MRPSPRSCHRPNHPIGRIEAGSPGRAALHLAAARCFGRCAGVSDPKTAILKLGSGLEGLGQGAFVQIVELAADGHTVGEARDLDVQ